jgi:hypothetical protein
MPPADKARKNKGQGNRKCRRSEEGKTAKLGEKSQIRRRAMRDLHGSIAPRSAPG